MNDFLKFIQKALNSNNERIVLQRFYLLTAVFGFVVASFLNIFENSISRIILLIVIASIGLFLANSITWTLGEALKKNFISTKKISSKTPKNNKS